MNLKDFPSAEVVKARSLDLKSKAVLDLITSLNETIQSVQSRNPDATSINTEKKIPNSVVNFLKSKGFGVKFTPAKSGVDQRDYTAERWTISWD